ncbi:hypothetical protein THOM_3203 [Trachipleistophora hominis]|uniref:Uncharacterized protein n=1 Tax=Trachipleistophora hominis TaxID=72359 RepID=L7JS63_TRAHO|nr:hypothetical protein THOM_3203 [Trachipleistophora hominis]
MTYSLAFIKYSNKEYIFQSLKTLSDPEYDVNEKLGIITQMTEVILSNRSMFRDPEMQVIYHEIVRLLPDDFLYDGLIVFLGKTCLFVNRLQNILFENNIFDYLKYDKVETDAFIYSLCYRNYGLAKYYFEVKYRSGVDDRRLIVMLKDWYIKELSNGRYPQFN